jgi:hypothetical protein
VSAGEDSDADSFDDEGADEGADEDAPTHKCDDPNSPMGKPAKDHPEWKWILARSSIGLVNQYMLETQKRDQDFFGCYFYNDFTGYGMQEVVENMITAARTEYRKRDFNIDEFWKHIQAIAMWLHTADTGPWSSRSSNPFYRTKANVIVMDDGERYFATAELIGSLALAAMNSLERGDLLKPNSRIPNIALIFSLYLSFAARVGGEGADVGKWASRIIAYLNHHNIEFPEDKTMEGISDDVEMFTDPKVKYEKFRKAGEDRWGFKTAFNKFVNEYYTHGMIRGHQGIGGDQYDITKMTKQERKKAAFDNKDPLDEMGPPPA